MKKTDSVWLVGASSGIGAALAQRLLQEGHRVALSARRGGALHEVVTEAGPGYTNQAFVQPCDVTQPDSVKTAYRAVRQTMGTPDCVIANAGTYEPANGKCLDAPACKKIFDTNLYGASLVIATVLPDFLARGSGTLAGVASVAGYRGLPRAAAYCASKAGLIAFLESLRFDVAGKDLDVTVINPGFVKTPLTDKNDFAMPFLITAEKSAHYIYRGLRKRKKEIHYPPAFSWSMKLLRVLPRPLYEAIVRKMAP
jgi:short-subunit dehydrogenase